MLKLVVLRRPLVQRIRSQNTSKRQEWCCQRIYCSRSGIHSMISLYLSPVDDDQQQLNDELTRLGYIGVLWALGGGNSIGFPPILNYGSEELKDKLLPGIIDGSIRVCLGVTEPQAGSDVAGVQTTAQKSSDGKYYVVNGQKKWYIQHELTNFRITNGIWADYITAAVRTGDAEKGALGVSVLVIPLNAEGVTRRKLKNSGVAASGSTFLEFDDVKVPASHLLGKENQGFQIIMSSSFQSNLSNVDFNSERLALAIQALSLSRVCLQDAYMHALTRETFSQKLISHQIIRHKIGLMSSRIASMHAWLETLIYTLKINPNDPSLPQALSLAKVQGGRLLEFCSREAQQIFGGAGYQRGSGKGSRVEQISRDVRVNVVGGGSEEILIDLAVRMGLKYVSKRPKL